MAHKHLSRDFETLVFAHDSYPVILFPTSRSRYFENKDFKLVELTTPLTLPPPASAKER